MCHAQIFWLLVLLYSNTRDAYILVTMHFMEKLDATSLRVWRAIEVLWIKLARTRSDIAFLSQCNFFYLIPNGLALRKPMQIRMKKTDICKKASE